VCRELRFTLFALSKTINGNTRFIVKMCGNGRRYCVVFKHRDGKSPAALNVKRGGAYLYF